MWEVVAPLRPRGWEEMKALVEARYGLSDSRIRDCFYAMKPELSEKEEDFVLRVEDERLRLGENSYNCFKEFVPKLSTKYRRGLEQVQLINMQVSGAEELTWD